MVQYLIWNLAGKSVSSNSEIAYIVVGTELLSVFKHKTQETGETGKIDPETVPL